MQPEHVRGTPGRLQAVVLGVRTVVVRNPCRVRVPSGQDAPLPILVKRHKDVVRIRMRKKR
eukprot:593861-Alexandrium_andersonii.AAC.2